MHGVHIRYAYKKSHIAHYQLLTILRKYFLQNSKIFIFVVEKLVSYEIIPWILFIQDKSYIIDIFVNKKKFSRYCESFAFCFFYFRLRSAFAKSPLLYFRSAPHTFLVVNTWEMWTERSESLKVEMVRMRSGGGAMR